MICISSRRPKTGGDASVRYTHHQRLDGTLKTAQTHAHARDSSTPAIRTLHEQPWIALVRSIPGFHVFSTIIFYHLPSVSQPSRAVGVAAGAVQAKIHD